MSGTKDRISANSTEFPLFSSNRYASPSELSPKRTGLGKLTLPDCSHGNSNEFPTYFHNKHQLKSRLSIDNPYVEEDFRDKTIKEVRRTMPIS